jgi:hypothetical protein
MTAGPGREQGRPFIGARVCTTRSISATRKPTPGPIRWMPEIRDASTIGFRVPECAFGAGPPLAFARAK